MQWMNSMKGVALPWPGPPIARARELGSGNRGSRSHTVQRSPGPRDPAPDALRELSPGGGVSVARDEALGGAGRESEPGEESAPRLVAHLVGAEGDAGYDDVVDESGEAHPGPRGGGEEDGVGAVPEGVDAAREPGAAGLDEGVGHTRGELLDEVVAGAKDEHAPTRPRLVDRAGDVVEVHAVGDGGVAAGLEGAGDAALGEPEPHPAIAAWLEVRPRGDPKVESPRTVTSVALDGPVDSYEHWGRRAGRVMEHRQLICAGSRMT